MDKETLCRLVDELKFVEVFEELDKWEIQNTLLSNLRNEFIAGEAKYQYPDRLKVFIRNQKDKSGKAALTVVVITANQEQIKQNGKKYNCKVPENRYHPTDLDQWQPFESPEKIKELFAEYQQKKGFPLQYQCVHEFPCDDLETREWIRENRQNMVLWADLLALNENNEDFAKYFNDGEIGGLLTSHCVADHEETTTFVATQSKKMFQNRKDDFENYKKECGNIAFGISNKEWLFRILTNIAVLQKVNREIDKEDKNKLRDISF